MTFKDGGWVILEKKIICQQCKNQTTSKILQWLGVKNKFFPSEITCFLSYTVFILKG